MTAKLQAMIDKHEIWEVLQRYGRGLDRFDRELVKSCYFDDAIDDHGDFVGAPDDFIGWANETSGHFINCHHGLMNHFCELAGDDAYTETYFLFMGVAAEPPHLMTMGRYVDHFQRRNGEWRIANRVALIEKSFGLTDAPPAWSRTARPDEPRPARDRNDVSYQRPLRPRRAL